MFIEHMFICYYNISEINNETAIKRNIFPILDFRYR